MERQERSTRNGEQVKPTPAPILVESKKTLFVEKKGQYSNMYKISYTGGGEIPDILKGDWTSPTFAENAIRGYLAGKKE